MSDFPALAYEYVQTDHPSLLAVDKILQQI